MEARKDTGHWHCPRGPSGATGSSSTSIQVSRNWLKNDRKCTLIRIRIYYWIVLHTITLLRSPCSASGWSCETSSRGIWQSRRWTSSQPRRSCTWSKDVANSSPDRFKFFNGTLFNNASLATLKFHPSVEECSDWTEDCCRVYNDSQGTYTRPNHLIIYIVRNSHNILRSLYHS